MTGLTKQLLKPPGKPKETAVLLRYPEDVHTVCRFGFAETAISPSFLGPTSVAGRRGISLGGIYVYKDKTSKSESLHNQLVSSYSKHDYLTRLLIFNL
jgi:hypothetical protein